MTGGLVEVGVLGVPWVLVALYGAAVGLVVLAAHNRDKEAARHAAAASPRATRSRSRASWAVLAVAMIPMLFSWAQRDWDPLWAVGDVAPGPEVVDVRSDGTWQDDSIEHASSWSWTVGDPCLSECAGPRWIYRLEPGQTYSFVITVENHSSLPIRLLGRPPREGETAGVGLALLRDPSQLSADPANLVPFAAVSLGANDTVAIAIVAPAPPCANPAAEIQPLVAGQGWSTGYPLVYELVGWQRTGIVWPHMSISIAGCEDITPIRYG